MTRKMLVSSILAQFVLAGMLGLYYPSLAGPPLICWPFDIGTAESLPFDGPHWGGVKADYDRSRLVEDTMALLTPDMPVIVRMETLRRATVYASKDVSVASELLAGLVARAQDAEAKGRLDALASFDAGYLIEGYKQAAGIFAGSNPAAGMDGYGWILRALGQRTNDCEMEFAAALITVDRGGEQFHGHLQKAVTGAADGSLLARNLVRQAHLLRLRARSVAEIRSEVGFAKN